MVNSSYTQNLKSLSSAVAKILKGDSKMQGSSPRPKPRTLFFYLGFFMMGFGKPQRLEKFEVAGFVYYGNI